MYIYMVVVYEYMVVVVGGTTVSGYTGVDRPLSEQCFPILLLSFARSCSF